jgi:hypothetical protein
VFAVEAEKAFAAIFAGMYVGAGVGLISGTLLGSPLTLVAQLLNAGTSTWFDALDVAGMALLWGMASGAACGLAVSIVIVAFNLRTGQQSQKLR